MPHPIQRNIHSNRHDQFDAQQTGIVTFKTRSETEAEVKPDSVADDFRGEAVPGVEAFVHVAILQDPAPAVKLSIPTRLPPQRVAFWPPSIRQPLSS